MTPQQIHEHKRSWLPGYTVEVHSDLHLDCIQWCKSHCEQFEYHFVKYHLMYTNLYHFEHYNDALLFEEEFRERKESKE